MTTIDERLQGPDFELAEELAQVEERAQAVELLLGYSERIIERVKEHFDLYAQPAPAGSIQDAYNDYLRARTDLESRGLVDPRDT